MSRLTPYDTGDRMEPKPWPLRGDDDYGRVDFENDEGGTTLTVLGRTNRLTGESTLEVSLLDEEAKVTVDGDPVLVLTPSALSGLQRLVEFAERGWDDFSYQASETDDYTEKDVEAAKAGWEAAQAAARLVSAFVEDEDDKAGE